MKGRIERGAESGTEYVTESGTERGETERETEEGETERETERGKQDFWVHRGVLRQIVISSALVM